MCVSLHLCVFLLEGLFSHVWISFQHVSAGASQNMRSKATLIVAAQVGIVLCEICVCIYVPRVERRGLTTFARRNKACVSCKFIHVILSGNFWILELGLSPKNSTQID